jgi:uncharacterized protein (DUF1697 family)
MAQVVFLRAVNVGGHQTFQPSALARELADLDVVNIGAAGTFVVRKRIAQASLRAELRKALKFDAEMMIVSDRDVLALLDDDPFAVEPGPKEAKRYVTILAKRPRKAPELPIERPAGSKWEVRVFAVDGVFALSYARRLTDRITYPNAVIEKRLGLPATTRNWNTFEAIAKVLRA